MSIRLLPILAFLFFANTAFAQQVYPVSLTGLLIPPHSLDLSVYGTQRAQDLVFTAALTDPIEPFRDTRLKLYIENNGQTLYTTDPNYGFQPLRLNMNQPVMLDGFALQPYLQPEALIGAAGQGQGSVIVPEGLNRICLEVIDLERNVPISRKTCVTGGFFLNEPPILQTPTCFGNVPQTNFQSQTFTWTPLHSGSGNSPAPVEYLFQLVQLQPGIDPNDGFDFSLKIMERTTMSPSLIYGPTDPILQPGQVYAWRVQARNMLKPGLIFRNYGFSAICTFIYGDGFALPGGEMAAEVAEEDRVPPQGCEVFDTDFGPIYTEDYTPAAVQEGDTIKVGWFDLVVQFATSQGNGYRGRGTVKIPMLNAPLMVDFRNLKVKPNSNRCYELSSMYAVGNTPQFYYEMQDGSAPPDYYFSQIKADFENGPLQNALTDQLDINGAATTLPLGNPSEEGPYMVIVNEINFTPRNATMTCTGYQVNEDGTLNGFGPTEIPITPYGVKNGARLKVTQGTDAVGSFAGIFFVGSGGETDKTGMDIDCGGFKSLFLDTEFVIDSTLMKSLDGSEARFRLASNKADPNGYLGGIKKLDGFTLPKLPGCQFKLKSGMLDLAFDKKLEQNKLEKLYLEPSYDTWQGLYLSDVEANLPADLNLLGDGKPVQLDNGDFVLDWSGGHGHFRKTNLLSLNKGRLGTWPYSIDSLQLQIVAGEAQRTWMSGQVKVPVLDEPFSYASELNTFGQTSLQIDLVQGQRTMSLWNGKMAVGTDSKVRAVLKDFGPAGKKFMPDADLSGVFSMEIDPKEFDDRLVGNKAIIKQRLKQIFGYAASSPEFKLENLRIGSLQIDPFKLPEERYVLGSYTPDSLGLSIGKTSAKLGQIRLVYKENDGNGREELGFQVVVKKGQNLVQFTFFAKAKANGDGFEFDRIEVQTEEVDCNCHAFVPFEEMQLEELDQQLRRTYRKFYAPAVGGNLVANSTGLASAKAPDFAEQNSQLLDAYETATLENLRNHLVGGFPLVDEVLNLTFLDLQLDMEGTKAKVAIERSSPDFNFEKIDELPTDGPRQLPLYLTPDLLTKMGMTNNELPKNSRLLITDFEAANPQYNEQNTSVEFTLLVQVNDSSYAQFVRPNVRVSPTSVDMKDFYMFLAEDVAVNDPDFNDGEGSPTVFFKKSEPKTGTPDPYTDSYAHLICEGFQKFVIQGEYAVPFSETTEDEEGEETDFPDAQLKYRDAEKDSPSEAESQLQFAFRFVHDFNLDNELELGDFIAAVKSETADGKPLQFVADGQEGVLFQEGKAMEVYFDFDQDFNVDSMPAQAGYDFRGIYFKTITAELEGFVANDTSNIKVDVTDIYFKPDEDFYFNGMGGSFELYDILPFDRGIKMGGWQYSLDTLVMDYIAASEEDEGMPVQIAGMLRCPVFKYDSEEDLLAYNGQLAFVRETDEETEELNYHPGAVFTVGEEIEVEEGEEEPENEGSLEGMVFRAEFIPGLTLALDEGSTIGFDWTEMPDGRAGFLPSVDLSGTATLLFSKKATEMAAEAVEVAQKLGIDFSLPGATFEGLKINKEPNEEEPGNVMVGNKLGGIQTINMGTWGYSLGFSEEFYEGLGEEKKDSTAAKTNKKEETKKEETKKLAPKAKNKKSKAIAKGKGKSAGNKPKATTKPTASTAKKPESKKDETPEKPGMNGFPISIDAPEFEYNEVTKKWAMNLAISINLLPEKSGDDDKKEGEKTPAKTTKAKAPKAPAKGKAAKKTEVRTAGIAATTTLSFYAKPDAVKGIVYDGVGLKSIHVMGQFASAEIEGGLHFIKPQTEEDEADWGEGFKAYGSIRMGKTPDGEYRLRGKALFQFGTVARPTGTGDFRYFFADLEALYSTNIQPHKGLPLIKAVPPAPPMDIINLHGGGGGIYYNMEKDPVISDDEEAEAEEDEPEVEEAEADEEEEEADKEEAAAKQEEAKADSTINDPKKTQAEKAEAKKKKTAAKANQIKAKEKKTKAQTKKEKAKKAKEKKLAEAKPGAKKRSNKLKGKKKAATTTKATEATAAASPKKKKAKKVAPPPKEEKADEEEEVDEEAEYEVPEGEWMEPGVSLSGFTYSPKEKSYGGYIKGIFSVVQPKLVSLDVAIGIEVGKNTADKFVFKKIFAKADGYMMSEGIDERTDAPIYATVQAELDFANKLLAGSFNIEADYAIEPILKIRIDGKKTRGSMLVEFKEGGQFYIKAGRPLERMGAEMEAFGDKLGVYAYFQLGQDLDPMPQVAEIVPGWPAPAEKIKEREINPSSGIALGMSLFIERNYDFAIFYASFRGGLGFDVAMGRSDLKCPDGYQVGMDGWMMKGQIFAYAAVDVGLRYKLGAMKGKVSILRASIGASLRGQFPNPSVFSGQLAGNYSVLGGLIDGSFNLKFQIASDKDRECLKGLLSKPNPLAEFPLVAETYPNADENEDIPIFAQPKLAYNMSVGYEIKVDDVDDAGNDVVRYYKASLDPSEGFILKKKSNGVKVPCQPIFEAKSTTLKPLQMLEPQTEYTMSWKLKWQEKKNGAWVDIKDDKGKVMAEDSFVVFTTGELPEVIVNEFLDYHAPGRDQRYWHPGYADTRIKFDKAAPPGTDWQQQYFPKNKYVQGFGNVNYDYIVRLTRFENGEQEGVFDVPLSEYPSLKNFQVPVTTYVQVGTMFVIPRVEVQNAQGLNVGFAGLNELITNDAEWKGKLYQIQLMRLPLLPKTEVEETETTTASEGAASANASAGLSMTDADLETTSQTAEASSVSIPKTSLVSNESRLPEADGLKIIYEYWFATSQYNSLTDKLKDSKLTALQSSATRADFDHPDDETEQNFSYKTQTADFNGLTDDYYAFVPKLEGFDQFDLDRIRLNARLEYPDAYPLKNTIWDPQGGGKYQQFADYLLLNDGLQFWWEVTDEWENGGRTPVYRTKLEESYKARLKSSDPGVTPANVVNYWKKRMTDPSKNYDWLGRFLLPDSDKDLGLTSEEIENQALTAYQTYTGQKVRSGFKGNLFQTATPFALVVQDVRYRILGLQYLTMRTSVDGYFKNLGESINHGTIGKYEDRFRDKWADFFWQGEYPDGFTHVERHMATGSNNFATLNLVGFKNWYLNLLRAHSDSKSGGNDIADLTTVSVKNYLNAGFYKGKVEITMPELGKWQDMGQSVQSSYDAYQKQKFTVYPNRPGVSQQSVAPTAIAATNTGADAFIFSLQPDSAHIYLETYPRDADISSIEIQVNGKKVAFWDAKAREADLYNYQTGKRAIKYDVSLTGEEAKQPSVVAYNGKANLDGRINLANLFQIKAEGGNPIATWTRDALYKQITNGQLAVKVLLRANGQTYSFEDTRSTPDGINRYDKRPGQLYNLNQTHNSQRERALHFSRGAGANANMLTMEMLGANGGWDFGACLIVDKETNQAVAHLAADRTLTKYSYSATGYLTQTSSYTDGEPMVELDPTRNYALYVAKAGQTQYGASLLLDKEAFWQDKVGQFFEGNTFGSTANMGTVEAPKPVGFS
ncbi:MAG: hypothetical protein IT258_10215, partial [Saprospiraceae bacterium]|nr:hypothetical protein [Saprospiraceae bacterium]